MAKTSVNRLGHYGWQCTFDDMSVMVMHFYPDQWSLPGRQCPNSKVTSGHQIVLMFVDMMGTYVMDFSGLHPWEISDYRVQFWAVLHALVQKPQRDCCCNLYLLTNQLENYMLILAVWNWMGLQCEITAANIPCIARCISKTVASEQLVWTNHTQTGCYTSISIVC